MTAKRKDTAGFPPWRKKLHELVFEADTPLGKIFDVVLFTLIILSVLTVMIESVESVKTNYGIYFYALETIFTIFFSFEYIARIVSLKKPKGYVLSFYGLIDLLAILPYFISLFLPVSHSLVGIRTLRLVRIFRVLKLAQFLTEAATLQRALLASRAKITVFLVSVLSIVTITGSVMYMIEPPEAGFTSIPQSIYWSIVTLTTVGYGDIAPVTVLGKFFASFIMIIGYAIIVVPTGIVTAELTKNSVHLNTRACLSCSKDGHDEDATYCRFCGEHLELE